MKVSILLSGRINSYKYFLKLLSKIGEKYDVDVFISINDTYSDAYENIKQQFGKYLKGFQCEEYNVPDNFKNVWYNKVEGMENPFIQKFEKDSAAYRTLSCVYNDTICFNMATKYADDNKFEYDVYIRTRSDIIVNDLPNFDIDNIKNNVLFAVIPFSKFTMAITNNPRGEMINGRHHCYGDIKHHGKWVTNDIAYGNRNTMSTYCSCYDYVLQENEKNKGNYFICFENTITIFLEESGINWKFFDYKYIYDTMRHKQIST